MEERDCKPEWKQWQHARDLFLLNHNDHFVFYLRSCAFSLRNEISCHFQNEYDKVDPCDARWLTLVPLKNKAIENGFLHEFDSLFGLFIVHHLESKEIDDYQLEKQNHVANCFLVAHDNLLYIQRRICPHWKVDKDEVIINGERLKYLMETRSKHFLYFSHKRKLNMPNIVGTAECMENVFGGYVPFVNLVLEYCTRLEMKLE